MLAYLQPCSRNRGFLSSCVFPFRYGNVLYYGCTDPNAANVSPAGGKMCAIKIDSDFHATEMAECAPQCHMQSKLNTS